MLKNFEAKHGKTELFMESLMEEVEFDLILQVTVKLRACSCVCVQGRIYLWCIVNSFYSTLYFKDTMIGHSTTFKMQNNKVKWRTLKSVYKKFIVNSNNKSYHSNTDTSWRCCIRAYT